MNSVKCFFPCPGAFSWAIPGMVRSSPTSPTTKLPHTSAPVPQLRLDRACYGLWCLQNLCSLPWLVWNKLLCAAYVCYAHLQSGCPLTAVYFSLPFFPPFCLIFGWGKLPTPGVRRNAENEVKGAKISQRRFFKADPPLGPMSVRRACSTQLHHAVRKRDLESNPHMQLFLLLPWIESPWQGRKVNPSLGGRLCQPCRQSVLQQGAV